MNIQDFFNIGMKREIPELIPDHKTGLILNLGGGNQKINNAINLQLPDWNANFDKIPFDDESVDQIHMYHLLEHLSNPIFCLKECQRVLKKGGHCNIVVPYHKSDFAYEDMTHCRFYSMDYLRVTMRDNWYDVAGNSHKWKFNIHVNFVMGITNSNLAIFTQIIKV